MQNYLKLILLFKFLITSTLLSQDKELDLFILAGQSNANGQASNAKYYPADNLGLDKQIPFNYSLIGVYGVRKTWFTLEKQEGWFEDGYFGPEITFARELKKSGINVAMFKYTLGGTSIYEDWKKPGEGGYYDKLKEDLKKAIISLENDGYNVKIRGFVWIQGEADSYKQFMIDDYSNSLKLIIKDFRDSVAYNPNLNFVLSVDEQFPSPIKKMNAIVDIQKQIAKNDSHIIFSSMIGLPKADVTHLTAEGTILQGKRLFNDFMLLEGNPVQIIDNNLIKVNYYEQTDALYINVDKDLFKVEFSIYNLNGKKIYNTSMENNYLDLDMSQFGRGVYFIKFKINDKLLRMKKFIK